MVKSVIALVLKVFSMLGNGNVESVLCVIDKSVFGGHLGMNPTDCKIDEEVVETRSNR